MGDWMETTVFKPKYTLLVYVLFVLYSAPWLFSVPNALFGGSIADWKIFWLMAGTVWALAGLLHMQSALVRRITFNKDITIEMVLQRPFIHLYDGLTHISGDIIVFSGHIIPTRYLSNADKLLHQIKTLADCEKLNLTYEEHGRKDAGWSVEKNLFFLIGFSLYMMAMLALRVRPFLLIGPATDAFLLGWAIMLPVLLGVKLVRWVRERMFRHDAEPKWI